MNSKLRLFSRIFLVIFVLASLSAFFLLFFPEQSPIPPPPSGNSLTEALTILGSISAAVISLLGFGITTALSFRREKREARESELALKQREVELERTRLEFEQLKQDLSVKSRKKAKPKKSK